MALIVNGILCQEIVDQFSEEVDIIEGPSAKKGFLCPWGNRFQVAIGLLGLSTTTSIGGLISLQTPAQYPEIPTIYCHHIEIEPKGLPFQGAAQLAYPNAIVWAHYRTFPWSFGPDAAFNSIAPYIYAEQQLNSSCEWVTIPGRATMFNGSMKPTGQDYGFRLANVTMVITLHRVPYLPVGPALSYAGAINSVTYLGVPPGQLLFEGCQSHRTHSTDGTSTTDVTYTFQARQQPWDWAIDPSSGNWDLVLTKSGGTIIPRVDLSQVIPTSYGY